MARGDGHTRWQVLDFSADLPEREMWDRLNRETRNQPVLDGAFWEHALQNFGYGNEKVCFCEAGQDIIAATIVRPLGAGRWVTVSPSQAPLGAWITSCRIPDAELLGPLATALPGLVTSVSLVRLDPAIHPRPDDRERITSLDYILTGRIVVDGSFDQYWQGRSKNLRRNSKRQRNFLQRSDLDTNLNVYMQPEEMAGCVERYGQLESAGWKVDTGTAVHMDNEQGQFYRDILEYYAARNEAVVYEYSYGTSLVAVDLCLVRDGGMIILKTTYRETESKTSPAHLMREESLQHAISHLSIRTVEFFGRKMDWHTKWTDDFRQMYHLNYDRIPFWPAIRRFRKHRASSESP